MRMFKSPLMMILKKLARKREFAIITGLNCVSNRFGQKFEQSVKRWWSILFDSGNVTGYSSVALRVLFKCPTKDSKVDNRIPRLLNWKTIAPRSRFECLINAMFNDHGKVVFKNIEPTKKELSKLQIPQKNAIQHERFVDFDDDFQDPPPRNINEHSKKKQKEQVVDIEADKPNVNEGGLEQSGQHFSSDVVQSLNNISDGTKTSDEKIDEIILSDVQFTIPNEMLPSLNAYQIQSITIHPSANRQEESHHEILDAKTSETVIEDHAQMNRGITDLTSNSLVNSEVELATEEKVRTPPNTQKITNDEQRDEQLWLDSQNTIPDEFLPSLNVNDQKSIMIHPSANRSSAEIIRIFPQKHPFLYHPIDGIIDMKIVKNFKDWISADLLKATAKRKGKVDHYKRRKLEIPKMHFGVETVEDKNCSIRWGLQIKHGQTRSSNDVYSMDHQNLKAGGQEHHLIEYINGFRMHAAVPWHQDYGVFMVMYAKCLSYGHKVIATEFDPNALRTRYAALLWDYEIRKQEANAISDVEAPLRLVRQSRITSVTEVVDV
ncbi:hypothetical protein FXO37_23255 [Capsicum annuum]|nr:hypothetical protein FXO37_23255 [Capsicum annuum]